MSDVDLVKGRFKVNKETAEDWFEDFAIAMDFETDLDSMDEDDAKSFKGFKGTVVRGIMIGSLVFDDEGQAVYTPRCKDSKLFEKPFTVKQRSGASMMEMDGIKKNHDTQKMYKVFAAMAGLRAKDIAGMVGPDIKMCEALFVLLMA